MDRFTPLVKTYDKAVTMKYIVCAVLLAALSACGGGGGNSGVCSGSAQYCSEAAAASTAPPAANVVISADSVAQQCAAPRPAGSQDPFNKKFYGDVQGSLSTEKAWIKAFVNETYLWYDEVVSVDADLYTIGATVPYVEPANNSRSLVTLVTNTDVVNAFFNSQRTTALTAGGKPKDQFHYTVATAEWTALSTAGSSVGFGFQVSLAVASPPRKALIAFSEPGSIAAANGLTRGVEFVSVNGVAVSNGSAAVINEGLFSPVAGQSYSFGVLDVGSSVTRTVMLTPATVTAVPVQNVRTLAAPYADVGYIQFNDHIATAESQLIAAVNQLKAANGGAGITDLVLDLRYNSGGFLDLASELAYMVAGSGKTAGKVFEKLSFNDKNPFKLTDANTATPFHAVTQGFSTRAGEALPQLGLPRVFVITGANTCSASEAIINGLRGAGVEVIQIGGTTCGKPYGFYPTDNCSVTYFAIQFKGVNQLGFGDYADGFIPGGTGALANNLPGCPVADDFTKPLGDITEGRLAAALKYRSSGSCGAAGTGVTVQTAAMLVPEPMLAGRSVLQQNRIYRPKAD
jgi:C-terminal processing protease CtpA/Prc